jgi:Icc-related predicted phosphoesterase
MLEDGTYDYKKLIGVKFQERDAYFTPEKSVSEHKETLRLLKEKIASKTDAKWIVVGHHAPSKLSTKPQYEKDVIVNGAYSSDLSEFILDHPQIKLWTHGHTHHDFDYMIGGTRVVANPRGYIGYEEQADIFNLKFVEV